MHDILIFIQQAHQESLILDQKGKSWKQKEKEAEETVYKTWVSDLFTRTSWERWFNKHTKSYAEYVKSEKAKSLKKQIKNTKSL